MSSYIDSSVIEPHLRAVSTAVEAAGVVVVLFGGILDSAVQAYCRARGWAWRRLSDGSLEIHGG